MDASTSKRGQPTDDESNNSEQGLVDAAKVIQTKFREHLLHKKKQQEDDQVTAENCDRIDQMQLNENTDEDELDKIDLKDPKLNKAASKIQAMFRKNKDEPQSHIEKH